MRPTTEAQLKLSRVVLYRNGVAYFERSGVADGDRLTLKVRKDQVNDLLKSLTLIDRTSGKTVSVSIPLDPRAWQDAALSMLLPGRGQLAEVLDALRGTEISVATDSRRVTGRIVMVERTPRVPLREPQPQPREDDHKLTLLNGDTLEIVQLSEVKSLKLRDGDLIMQLDRHLDASAGEGMFQQVDVVAHFADAGQHDLTVSYVAQAPLWKPTYRLVLADDGSGKALLQAWAVVSNVSGENWNDVSLSLTSGSPLAFRYDLHTPQDVARPDLTQSGVDKHAQVAFGETTFAPPAEAAPPQAPMAPPAPAAASMAREQLQFDDALREDSDKDSESEARKAGPQKPSAKMLSMLPRRSAQPAAAPGLSFSAMVAQQPQAASAKRVAGLTRFDIAHSVSLPDGSASMVQLVNQLVPGEQTFLYIPGGSGQGYERNPYRVVRFLNDTDFVLEPGPISIYASGSFVGEGLSEAIASHDRATIPFAAEPSIIVRSDIEASGAELKVTRIVRGVVEVQSFQRVKTTWQVEAKSSPQPQRVLVRQPRASGGFELVNPPKETESLPDGYFIPVVVPPNQTSATLDVVEQTPSKLSLDIWNDKVPDLLGQLLTAQELSAEQRATLAPIIELRQAIGRIDTEIEGLQAQQAELDERAEAERENLLAIQKDPNAAALRKRLSQRLEQLTQQAAQLGRSIVERSSQRMEKKIALDDRLRDLDLTLRATEGAARTP
jgi:hypothetical protein